MRNGLSINSMVGLNMLSEDYYSEGYELGLKYDFGPQMPPPPPLGIEDPTELEALSLWFDGLNCGIQHRLAQLSGVQVPQSKLSKISEYFKDITYELARLVRGTDCVHPSTKGLIVGQLLVKLRMLNGGEYDERVIQKRK